VAPPRGGVGLQAVTQVQEVRAAVQRELSVLEREGRCTIPAARGAFYFLLKIQSARAAMDMAERLIREHGVAVIPGNAFGLDRGCHLRVAYGALQMDTATEGIRRLVRGVQALA
jgi:aspartate/methionine/tyrosine aminotransferase